jgi:hypothetical protein
VVTGECEVLYDITPIPEAIINTQPELSPLDDDEPTIQIFKSQNFSNCKERRVYNFGFQGFDDIHPGGNIDEFMTVSKPSCYARILCNRQIARQNYLKI